MRQLTLTVFGICISSLVACGGGTPPPPETPATPPGVVDVTIHSKDFDMPATVPSGWVTFRMINLSPMTHMGVVERMPEGYGVKQQQEQVAPIFQEAMYLITAGDTDTAMKKFGEIPEWFHEIEFIGGPGLNSEGHVTETTVYLEPATYILECYVKTAGIFHSFNPDPSQYGMVAEFTVTDEASGAPEPVPTLGVTVDSEHGIVLDGEPTAGEHTIGVHFADQRPYESFVGHDVHLVRLTPETDEQALVKWMNWMEPDGLQTPAPAEFLGGVNELPAGSTGYFKANLTPGDYAFIAEVPKADEKRMFVKFTVS